MIPVARWSEASCAKPLAEVMPWPLPGSLCHMAQWHSVNLTNFDLAPAARTAQHVSGTVARRTIDVAKDATYVGVGLGLLLFQRAQVQRREFERSLRN